MIFMVLPNRMISDNLRLLNIVLGEMLLVSRYI